MLLCGTDRYCISSLTLVHANNFVLLYYCHYFMLKKCVMNDKFYQILNFLYILY